MRLMEWYLAHETQRCIEQGVRVEVIGRRDRSGHIGNSNRSGRRAPNAGRGPCHADRDRHVTERPQWRDADRRNRRDSIEAAIDYLRKGGYTVDLARALDISAEATGNAAQAAEARELRASALF